jgi:hypothetical protein
LGNLRADSNEHRRQAQLFDFTLNRDDRAVANVRSATGKHDDIGT